MAGAAKNDECAHEISIQTGAMEHYIYLPRTTGKKATESRLDMSTFDEREKGFENKFKHDEEFKFKATARRNKLLGLWAAELLGLNEVEAQAYAQEVVKSDFERPGDDDVLEKVFGDLQAKGVDTSEHIVRKHMDELMTEAMQQVHDGV